MAARLFKVKPTLLQDGLYDDHAAYVELMGKEPPPPHPSGQFGWKPKGALGTDARRASVLKSVSGNEVSFREL